jgi:hypothetical protein
VILKKFRYITIAAVAVAMIATASQASAQTSLSASQVLDRIVSQEKEFMRSLKQYSPVVETYIQNLEAHPDLGTVPKNDKYFLGKLELSNGLNRNSFFQDAGGFLGSIRDRLTSFTSVKYVANGFAQMVLIDDTRFDRQHYNFEYVRREFLGAIRCLAFDVTPKKTDEPGAFHGRIWVEDSDYHIVRFNGTYGITDRSKLYFHFDSWREQLGAGQWLPTYIYSEESDRRYFLGTRKLQFKAQTRLWGYNAGRSKAQNEFTSIIVESDKVEDNSEPLEQVSPVIGLRTWEREAEDNILQRLERAGLLAPPGPVDKVLETVVGNLEVTNDLNIDPEVRCRVLLTSPLESFTIGHTIVLSRGLIDVLPDEPSLAMVLAHELAHIGLGHRLDTKYAFNDRLLFEDQETFYNVFVKRDQLEEQQADSKAVEFLHKSPYSDKLASAGLFLRALSDRSSRLPNLLQGTMGNRLAGGGKAYRLRELMQNAPKLEPARLDQIAALPLGGRIRVNSWNNTIELTKAPPVPLLSAGEKLQFEIAPLFLYLTRQQTTTAAKDPTSPNN